MTNIVIRNYQAVDGSALKELHQSVTSENGANFWWVGPESNWANVFCAFEGQRMIAKGQVELIYEVPAGSPLEMEHAIYCNLKTVPERETDTVLLDMVFQRLVERSAEIKSSLSDLYKTMLCVGNLQIEKQNNVFFMSKGFEYTETVFTMCRDLTKSIPIMDLPLSYQFTLWNMDDADEQKEYLAYDQEIWPDAPLKRERLVQYRNKPSWTALTVREGANLIASAMAWKENDQDTGGIIEDVWVRKPWRKKGLAKLLLSEALVYLKDQGCDTAELEVSAKNASALQLYQAVGFQVIDEEVRYKKDIT
ncbi:GNAT family N-acetyltransferase [Sporosarcina sp. FSL W8-0480]|uniref:GNAT family N-acetyltransferase n=1 Tax=Sporosarcina sp. FSL W8-0480 TaxID=2954701 RepID=UPI0030DCD6DE